MGGAAQAAVAVRAVPSSARTAAAGTARPTARPVGAQAGDARHAAAALQARDAGEAGTAAEAGEYITAIEVQGGPSGRGTLIVDIKFRHSINSIYTTRADRKS